MPLNIGRLFSSVAKSGGAVMDDRRQRQAQEQASQERLEDRVAQKEMRDLQKRSLEQALNRPAAEPTWDTKETDTGEYFQIEPRSGQTRRVMLDGLVARAPKKAEPQASFSFQTDGKGNIVGINPKDPTQVVQTGVTAPPKATPEPAGAAGRNEKRDAAAATLAVLDEIAKDVEAGGTDIDPRSPRRAKLASNYAQFQLKLKDAARLGALSKSDMDIMENALNDPTSMMARAKVLGDADTHKANVLAGLAAVRSTLERESGGGEVPVVPRKDHSAMSDEEFAKAYRAGAFKKP